MAVYTSFRPGPEPGYSFVQRSGSRRGQSYNVRRGKSGMNVRKYVTGATAVVRPRASVSPTASPGASSAATQVPSSAPAPQGLPVDPAYDETVAGLARRRDETLASLAGQRSQGLLEYGYNPSYDASGTVSGLAFDANNPYSRAALMTKKSDQSRSGTGISMASRGQLYSGAFQNAQDHLNRGQLQDEDQLQKSLIRFLTSNRDAETRARTEYEEGVGRAFRDRVGRAESNPLYDPSAGDGGAPGATGATAPPAAPGATPAASRRAPAVSRGIGWGLSRSERDRRLRQLRGR